MFAARMLELIRDQALRARAPQGKQTRFQFFETDADDIKVRGGTECWTLSHHRIVYLR
jgi:hypothetical protein